MKLQQLKQDRIDRLAFRCKHSHNGFVHKNCYNKAKNVTERVAILDIEAEDLNADYGIVFCWCLYDIQTKIMHHDTITLQDIKNNTSKNRNVEPKEDKRVISTLLSLLENYDRVVAHYGSGFDIPFLRTRSVICGLNFPTYGVLYQTDTWIILKKKFKLSRNSLMNSTLKLLGKTRKDHLSLAIKHGCLRGEDWAINNSLEHCKRDVLDLRDLFIKIQDFTRKCNTSV